MGGYRGAMVTRGACLCRGVPAGRFGLSFVWKDDIRTDPRADPWGEPGRSQVNRDLL